MENNFKLEDYKKLFFELFYNADKNNCHLTIDFVKNNLELLKKTVGNNIYGVPKGSTVLHILAMKELNYTLVSAYSSQTFFRNIYDDIVVIISCLHKGIDDKKFINKVKELNLTNKQDANGKTVMDIIKENLEKSDKDSNKKYLNLKDIIEAIGNGEGEEQSHHIKIVIDNDAIISETTDNNKRIIILEHSNEKKNYKVFLSKRSKTIKKRSRRSSSLRKKEKANSI
jgi:hypothetical protein